MSVTVGTTAALAIRITQMPDDDDSDQDIGACLINGVPHHITLARVTPRSGCRRRTVGNGAAVGDARGLLVPHVPVQQTF